MPRPCPVRSPRVRYAAACAAMLVMLAGFGLTLLRLLPAQGDGARNVHAPVPYLANLSLASVAADGWIPSLAAIAPWLGPFWITGVCLFCLWYSASWISAERMRPRGVCCASAHLSCHRRPILGGMAIRALERRPRPFTSTNGQHRNSFLFQMAKRGCGLHY